MKSKIVVVGLGRSGIGAAKLLNFEGYEVIVIESAEGPQFKDEANKLFNDANTFLEKCINEKLFNINALSKSACF